MGGGIGSWSMSPRFRDVDAAYKWGVPLHIWDGTGPHPTTEQQAEMVAYVQARSNMDAWEAWIQRPNDSKGVIALEGNRSKADKGSKTTKPE
jgi:hypothetical protein